MLANLISSLSLLVLTFLLYFAQERRVCVFQEQDILWRISNWKPIGYDTGPVDTSTEGDVLYYVHDAEEIGLCASTRNNIIHPQWHEIEHLLPPSRLSTLREDGCVKEEVKVESINGRRRVRATRLKYLLIVRHEYDTGRVQTQQTDVHTGPALKDVIFRR